MRSEMLATPLGGYLETPHSFLSMTKRSQYQIDREDESAGESRGAIRPWRPQVHLRLPVLEDAPLVPAVA